MKIIIYTWFICFVFGVINIFLLTKVKDIRTLPIGDKILCLFCYLLVIVWIVVSSMVTVMAV